MLANDVEILQHWLWQQGISHSLTQKYVQNGWLKRFASGVFYRPQNEATEPPSWPALLSALSTQTDTKLHLAGLSSLQQQGMSHYLVLNSPSEPNQTNERVWIGTSSKLSLPKWFRELSNVDWVYCKSTVGDENKRALVSINIKGSELIASSPELAVYQVVSSVGKDISFEHLAEMFQGLVNLAPERYRRSSLIVNMSKRTEYFCF